MSRAAMLETHTLRTEWGAEIDATLVRDFIHAGIRHDALADFINEYIFDLARGDGELPTDVAEALRVAFDEILDAARPADWQRVARDLLVDAEDCLQEPAAPSSVPAPGLGPDRAARLELRDDAHARGRRANSDRLLDAVEELSREHPDRRPINSAVAARAKLSKELIFVRFGDTPGMYAALNTRRALRIPALWAELGCSEDRDGIEKVRATGREYLRLSREHPDAFQAIMAPLDPGASRTLWELTELLAQRIADQHRLLAGAISQGVADGSLRAQQADQTAELLWTAWTGVLTLARRGDSLRPDQDDLARRMALTTDTLLNGIRAI